MRQCDAKHITHYSRSRVILCAIGCRHSPRIASENAMVIDFGVKNRVLACENAFWS
jgi:hypothetical protein